MLANFRATSGMLGPVLGMVAMHVAFLLTSSPLGEAQWSWSPKPAPKPAPGPAPSPKDTEYYKPPEPAPAPKPSGGSGYQQKPAPAPKPAPKPNAWAPKPAPAPKPEPAPEPEPAPKPKPAPAPQPKAPAPAPPTPPASVCGQWAGWGACSRQCGTGSQSRSRSGSSCTDRVESQACNQAACTCGEWRSWGACSKECGGGDMSRTRTGVGCTSTSEKKNCNAAACTSTSVVKDVCNQWSAWGSCSKTCGGRGVQTRTRTTRTGTCKENTAYKVCLPEKCATARVSASAKTIVVVPTTTKAASTTVAISGSLIFVADGVTKNDVQTSVYMSLITSLAFGNVRGGRLQVTVSGGSGGRRLSEQEQPPLRHLVSSWQVSYAAQVPQADASPVIASAQQMRSDPSALKTLLKAKLVEIVKASGRDASPAAKSFRMDKVEVIIPSTPGIQTIASPAPGPKAVAKTNAKVPAPAPKAVAQTSAYTRRRANKEGAEGVSGAAYLVASPLLLAYIVTETF